MTIQIKTTIKKLSVAVFITFAIASCGDKNKNFDAMGVFESDEILVSSEIGGKIVTLDLREGDRLEKGVPVGQIDITQLQLSKEQLLKQVASSMSKKMDLEKQTAPTLQQIKTAEIEKARTIRLLKADAATQKNLDDINAQLYLYKKQLDAQVSSLSLANKSIDDEVASMTFQLGVIEDNIKKATIASPINGTVLEKYAYEGEISAPGKPLFKIAYVDTLRLKAYIIEPQLTKVKLGDNVKVFVDFGDKMNEYQGVVTWISDSAEFTPKTIMTKDERKNLVYAIKIDVKNDGYLKIGSYGEVKLAGNASSSSKAIPGIVK